MGKRIWDAQRNRYVRKYSFYMEKKHETPGIGDSLEKQMDLLSLPGLPHGSSYIKLKDPELSSQKNAEREPVLTVEQPKEAEKRQDACQGLELHKMSNALVKYIPKQDVECKAASEGMKIVHAQLRNFDFLLYYTALFPLLPACGITAPSCGSRSLCPVENKKTPSNRISKTQIVRYRLLSSHPGQHRRKTRRSIADWFIDMGKMLFACMCLDSAE